MKDYLQPTEESIAQGKRFKRLRTLLNFTQAQFARIVGYSRASINYWENAHHGGLTAEGAITSIESSKRYGVVCSLNWLLYGEGSPPYMIGEVSPDEAHAVEAAKNKGDTAEIILFKKNHAEHLVFELAANEAIFPFSADDRLAGVWREAKKWRNKKKFLALIDEGKGQGLILCALQQIKGKKFLKINLQNQKKYEITVDKFVQIMRWWAR